MILQKARKQGRNVYIHHMVFPHVVHTQRVDRIISRGCGQTWVTCLLRFCTLLEPVYILSHDTGSRHLTFGSMYGHHLGDTFQFLY